MPIIYLVQLQPELHGFALVGKRSFIVHHVVCHALRTHQRLRCGRGPFYFCGGGSGVAVAVAVSTSGPGGGVVGVRGDARS